MNSVINELSSQKYATSEEMNNWDKSINFIDEEKISKQLLEDISLEKYKFDFNALMIRLGIPRHLIYIHMKINNFNTPQDYNGETILKFIDNEYIENFYMNNIVKRIKK